MNTNSNNQAENLAKPVLANRLFKFRAWVKEQNRMIKVFGFNEHLVFEQTWDSPSIKENIFEIEDCHIMQFTGFKDFDGKEIYEGDILEDTLGRKKLVEYYKDGFWLNASLEGAEWCLRHVNSSSKVIGSIYVNPELLENNLAD